MNHYEAYKHARNLAWKTLLECHIKELPVNLNQIIDHYQICIVPYSQAENLSLLLKPESRLWDGFSCVIESNKYIFLNDTIQTKARRRFTIGHELGHILLGHNLPDSTEEMSQQIEMAANIFSRNLLSPAGVLDALGVCSVEEIMHFCDISYTSAKRRLERLTVLRKRNKFGTHPLERQVLKQFESFIQQNKRSHSPLQR